MIRPSIFNLILAIAFMSAEHGQSADILINITGNGSEAQYIEQGKSKQLNVAINVGDSVRWKNNGDKTHTATSDIKKAGGQRLFDVSIAQGATSAPHEFTQSDYDAAVLVTGGNSNQPAHIGYFCDKHPSLMGGKIYLKPVTVLMTAASGVRRDVTTLSGTELQAYRDSWRRIQGTAAYRALSGNHGCPDRYCFHFHIGSSERTSFLRNRSRPSALNGYS